jgi:hypothetical protein
MEEEDDEEEFEDIDEGDSVDDEILSSQSSGGDSSALSPPEKSTGGIGEGALGEEGYRLNQIFRPSQLQSSLARKGPAKGSDGNIRGAHLVTVPSLLSQSNDSGYMASSSAAPTYTPGITMRKPWTSRADGGINSRGLDGKHGDEIYYIGIIDILQQYNFSKKAETFFKVRT